MQLGLRNIKNFLTAEEIPRWMGLSLVGILVFGLIGVAYHSVADAHERFADRARLALEDAVDYAAWTMSHGADAAALQPALRAFDNRFSCDELRVVDESGLVVGSIDLSELGTTRSMAGTGQLRVLTSQSLPPDATGLDRRLVIAPFALATPARSAAESSPGEAKAPSRYFLECVVTMPAVSSAGLTRTGTAAVVLTVIILFSVVYRMMRMHFRSLSRISENLTQRGDLLEQDLTSLRLADTGGAVADQWNRLIDVVDELSKGAERATASAELKQVLEKSRRGELADVVNAVPDGVMYVVDRDKVSYLNTMACRVMEISGDDDGGVLSKCEGLPLDELQVGTTGRAVLDRVRGALDSDGSFRAVTDNVESEGGGSTYRVRVLPFNVRRHRGECVVTITDISQQVRADKAAEEFISQVTHELRTPLTNIRAYAETLSSGVFDDPKVITECYNVITKETRRLARLIEDVLSMSQLEVGTIQLHVNEVDMRALLTDSVRDVRGLADEKQIDMQLSLPSKFPQMRGDRDKLAIVINNLLGNAIKYTPAGGQVLVGLKAGTDEAQITVKDTGMGIDPVDHDRIFEKFQRGSAPEVAEITGTGIGLTTAREIARRHGGDIQIMSKRGEGATFIVRLPLTSGHSTREVGAVRAGTEQQ